MAYSFRSIFSGPCAYVPNRTAGGAVEKKSWSVLIPDLAEGYERGPIKMAPHYPVIHYRLKEFDIQGADPDLVFRGPDGEEFGLLRLDGYRITFDLAGASDFTYESTQVNNPAEGPESTDELRSLEWLPQLENLLEGAGTISPSPDWAPFEADGFPRVGTLAGHVLLTKGELCTNSVTLNKQDPLDCNIWDFKRESDSQVIATQAFALTVALEADNLTDPAVIHVSNSAGVNISLIQVQQDAVAEIKNREFEEIVGWAVGEIQIEDNDPDFELLYLFPGKAGDPERAIPYLKQGHGGLGTRRRTCGGATFSGFDDDQAGVINSWP